MKKLVFIMPLMAVSFLASCISNSPVEHFVSFDSKGGDHVNTQRVKDGGTAKEPDPVPKKPDYTFGGWYLNEDFSGDTYDFSKSITGDITLFAKWNGGPQPVASTYTIDFQGENCISPLDPTTQYHTNDPVEFNITIEDTSKYKLPEKINVSGVSKYEYSKIDGKVSFTIEDKDVAVIAKADEIEPTVQHTVTFVLNGATSDPIEPVEVNEGDQYPSDEIPTNPTNPGHTFEGWSSDEKTKNIVDLTKAPTINSDLILYAWWSETITHKITIAGDYIQSSDPLIFEYNKFNPISCTVGVNEGYKLTGGYSVNPNDSAMVEFTDTKTICITPKINENITITLGTEEDIKYYYSITASGEHISYYKDQTMNVPLNHAVAYIEEDLVFYMVADYTENSEGYIPPTTLNVKVKAIPIAYTIEDVPGTYQNVMKKVTIDKQYITGDIYIQGDAIKVSYYNISFPYFYGLKDIADEDSVFQYNKDATIEFKASDPTTNEDLITAENIYVNFTGGEEESAWICAADDAFTNKGKFEHTQDDKYILTINANVVDTSINTIQIIARAKSYHEILNEFTWEEINQMSGTSLAAKLFIAGDIKTTNGKTFRIIGFNKDELVESTNEDSKYAGITFECVNSLGSVCWFDDDVADIHDFRVSDLNTTCQENGDAYKAIPNEIMQYIKKVKKQITIYENGAWNTEATYDTQLFPLSNDEIEGNDDGTYEYYKTDSQNRRKKGVDYWLRIPYIYDAEQTPAAYYINTYGEVSTAYAGYYPKAVAPAFCI